MLLATVVGLKEVEIILNLDGLLTGACAGVYLCRGVAVLALQSVRGGAAASRHPSAADPAAALGAARGKEAFGGGLAYGGVRRVPCPVRRLQADCGHWGLGPSGTTPFTLDCQC